MQSIFTITFGVGLGYTVISLLLGNLLDMGDFEGGNFIPLRPAPIAAFLSVFGGTGMIFYEHFGFVIVLSIAGLIGFSVSFLLIRLVLIPLGRAQSTSTVSQEELIGITAVVNQKIMENSFGKIAYHVNGSNISSPAKSLDGNEIPVGEKVEIVSIDKNVYYVQIV